MGLLANLQLTELYRSTTATETTFYFTHLGCLLTTFYFTHLGFLVPATENAIYTYTYFTFHHILSAVISVTVNDHRWHDVALYT